MDKELTVLGLCNGQGVALHLFNKSKRFKVLGNIESRGEYLTPKNEQWKANFDHIPLFKSLETAQLNLPKRVDIIIGNPKCGGVSKLRLSRNKEFKEKSKVREEKSLLLFINGIHKFRPKVFLMENLPKLLENINREEWALIFNKYDLIFHIGSVSDFGNSQKSRIRLLIIGIKKGTTRINREAFLIKPLVGQLKSTSELLKGSRNINISGNIGEDPKKTLAMYDFRDPSKRKLNILEIQKLWTKDFKDEFKWPIRSDTMGTLPGVYRNRDNGLPMTARKADRQFREDGLPMTPRELARIMGIPDSFIIYHEKDRNQYWVNKGRLMVTQTFPYEIGIWFKKCILKSLE